MALKKGANIYFMGIGGTGMASVAGLFKDAGFKITGSDKGVYPPMSEMLEELAIPYKTPYASANIASEKPDMVVVANALSRGNEELEYMLANNVAYKSFPDLLGEEILAQRESIVVAGTHGKTTTTSICAYVLQKLGEEPGYLIGGIPRDFDLSFSLGKGPWFVIEGDEYDTAFFDKGPKFLHYRPKYAILNNLEFDHADIYQSLEQIEAQFAKFAALLSNPKHIIANIDDPGIARLLDKTGLADKVTRVSTLGKYSNADLVVKNLRCEAGPSAEGIWKAQISSRSLGNFEVATTLSGAHNMANVGQVIALLALINEEGRFKQKLNIAAMQQAFRSFQGVKRRLDLLGQGRGIEVYEDFAHHPTAIKLVIEGFRRMHPSKRLTVAFEPANATGRRNVLQNDFAQALAHADHVLIGKCPVDQRIAENERMNTTALADQIGKGKGIAFKENEDLLSYLKQNLKQGDAVIFMSSSSFSGIQHQLAKSLK
jgi:UDP-N-acetylmuramate: L-alanyl-gamma-D-glutamyl-meso-diaminopimelate ligase